MKGIVLIFMLITSNSFACICDSWSSDEAIDQAIRTADIVFMGTAEASRNKDMVFNVEKLYKGKSKIKVDIAQQANTCTMLFKIGQSYLILGEIISDCKIQTNSCRVVAYHPDIVLVKKILKRFN